MNELPSFVAPLVEAIMNARAEKVRLDNLKEKRPLKDSDHKALDQMKGRLSNIVNDLVYAQDEAEMLEIARKAVKESKRK